MSALGSLANALLDASRVADLNMHVGSYLLSGSDVRFGSIPACRSHRWIFNLATCYAGSNGRVRLEAVILKGQHETKLLRGSRTMGT